MSEEWAWRPLGQLFHIGAGKTMSAAARAGVNKVPFLRTSNVLWDRLDLSAVDKMAIPPHELPDKLVERGDLLVCEGGEIGRAAIWDGSIEPMAFQNHLHRLRPKQDDVDPRFYVYFLQSAFTQLGIFEGAGNRTTIPNLSSGRLAALDVPHPPLLVQQAVVAVLAAVRDAITVNDKAVRAAIELKQAVMADVLVRGLGSQEMRDTEIGPVPATWAVGVVGDFAEFQRGFDITKKEQVTSGPIPVVSSGGVKSFHNVAAVAGPGVVIGRKGSIGSVHYVATDFWPHDTTLWCKDFHGNDPKFVYYRLQTVEMKRLDSGATNPALNRNFLHEEPLSWPDVDEQKEIVDVIEAVDEKIQLHERRRDSLDELFRSLLYKLMTGEVSTDDIVLSPQVSTGGAA